MIMGDGYYKFENSGCSSTSTIEDEIDCNWNNWAPVVDWDPLSNGPDDFHGLIESMMLDNEPLSSMMRCDYDCLSPPQLNVGEGEDEDKELRIVHLLVAAAEALSGPHKSRELARVILVRLRELIPPAEASNGTNMERLAAHFTDALQSLLDGPPTGPTGTTRSNGGFHHHHHHRDDDHHPSDVLMAIQLLQDMAPYVKFGHFTANQAILEAISGDRRVHIIDYDIMEGVQWASLMQALVTQKDGPPLPHLRITAITGNINSGGGGKKSTGTIHETGRRLAAFAASIGQPFSFGQCRLDPNEKLRSSGIKLVKGETLIANCVLHPPHFPQRSATSVGSFLIEAATLGAKLVTLVEEEEGETRKGEDKDGFVGRFIDELYRYSAIWDSLEAGFPMQGRARGLVERIILGPRIGSAVKRAYWREKEGEKGGGEGRWEDWMSRMGFKRAGISFFNHCQAKLLLGLFNDGYKVEEDAANKLVLGWKSRRLITASVWSSPPPSPTPSTSSSGFTS